MRLLLEGVSARWIGSYPYPPGFQVGKGNRKGNPNPVRTRFELKSCTELFQGAGLAATLLGSGSMRVRMRFSTCVQMWGSHSLCMWSGVMLR